MSNLCVVLSSCHIIQSDNWPLSVVQQRLSFISLVFVVIKTGLSVCSSMKYTNTELQYLIAQLDWHLLHKCILLPEITPLPLMNSNEVSLTEEGFCQHTSNMPYSKLPHGILVTSVSVTLHFQLTYIRPCWISPQDFKTYSIENTQVPLYYALLYMCESVCNR